MAANYQDVKRYFFMTLPFQIAFVVMLYFMARGCEKRDRILASKTSAKAVVTQVMVGDGGIYVAFVLDGKTYQGRKVDPSAREWLRRPDVSIRAGDSIYVDYNAADPNEFFVNLNSWFELNK